MKGIKQRLKQTFASPSGSQLADTFREVPESNHSHSRDLYKFIEVEDSHSMYGQLVHGHHSSRGQPDTNRAGKLSHIFSSHALTQRSQMQTQQVSERSQEPVFWREGSEQNQQELLLTVPRVGGGRLHTSKSNPRNLMQTCRENLITQGRSQSKENLMPATAPRNPSEIGKGKTGIQSSKSRKELPFKNSALGLLLKKPTLNDDDQKSQKSFKFKSTSQPNLNELIIAKSQKVQKLEAANKLKVETHNATLTSKTKLSISARNMLEKFLRNQKSAEVVDRNSSQPSQASHSSRGGLSASKQLLGILTYRTASNRKALQAQLATTATGVGLSSGAQLSGKVEDRKVLPQQPQTQVVVGRFSAASRGGASSKTDSQNQRGGSIPSVSTEREGSTKNQRFSQSGHQRSLSHTLGDQRKPSRMLSPPNLLLGQTKKSIASSVLEPGEPHLIMQRLKQKLRSGPSADLTNAPANTMKNSSSGGIGSFGRAGDRSNSQTAVGEYLGVKGDLFKSRMFKKQPSRRTPSPLQRTSKVGTGSVSHSLVQQASPLLQQDMQFTLQPDEPCTFPEMPAMWETGMVELSGSDPLTHYQQLEEIDISRFFRGSHEADVFDDAEHEVQCEYHDNKVDTQGAFTFCHELQSKKYSAGVTFAGEQSPTRLIGFEVQTPGLVPARASSANKGNEFGAGQAWKQAADKTLGIEARIGKLSEQKGVWRITDQPQFDGLGSSPKNLRNPFFVVPDHTFEQKIDFLSNHGSGCQIEEAFSRDERHRDSVFAVDSFASEGSFDLGQKRIQAAPIIHERNYFEAFIHRNSSEKSANVLNSSKDISRFSSVAEEQVDNSHAGNLFLAEVASDEPDVLAATDPAYFLQFLKYCDEQLLLRTQQASEPATRLYKQIQSTVDENAGKSGRHRPKLRREDPAIHLDVCSNMVTKGFYLHNTHPDMTQIDDRDEFVTLDDNRDLKSMFGLKSQDFGKMALKDIDKDFDDRESFMGNKEQSVSGLRPPKSHRTLYGHKKSVNGDEVGMDLSPRMTSNHGSRNGARDNRKKLYQSGLAIQQHPETVYDDFQKLNSEKANQKSKRHFEYAVNQVPLKKDLPDYEEGLGIQSPPPNALTIVPASMIASKWEFSWKPQGQPTRAASKSKVVDNTCPETPSYPIAAFRMPRHSIPDTFCLSSATKSPGPDYYPSRQSLTAGDEKNFPTSSKVHFELDSEHAQQHSTSGQHKPQTSDFGVSLPDKHQTHAHYDHTLAAHRHQPHLSHSCSKPSNPPTQTPIPTTDPTLQTFIDPHNYADHHHQYHSHGANPNTNTSNQDHTHTPAEATTTQTQRPTTSKPHQSTTNKLKNEGFGQNTQQTLTGSVGFGCKHTRGVMSPAHVSRGLVGRFQAVGRIKASVDSADDDRDGRFLHFDSQSFVYRSEGDASQGVSASLDQRESMRISEVGIICLPSEDDQRTLLRRDEHDMPTLPAERIVPPKPALTSIPASTCKFAQNTTQVLTKDRPIQHLARSRKSLHTSRSGRGENGLVNSNVDVCDSSTRVKVVEESNSPPPRVPSIQVPRLVGLSRLAAGQKLQISSTSRPSREFYTSPLSGGSPQPSSRQMSLVIPQPSGKTASVWPPLAEDSPQLGSPKLAQALIDRPVMKAIEMNGPTSDRRQRSQRLGHREQLGASEESPYHLEQTGPVSTWDRLCLEKAGRCRQSVKSLKQEKNYCRLAVDVQSKQRQFE